jgi:hypothetical protein
MILSSVPKTMKGFFMSAISAQYLSLPAALRERGVSVSPATAWRWYTRGVHGVKLRTWMVGGRRMTTLDALDEFFASTTAAADSARTTSSPEPTGRTAETAARLAAAGIL